MRGHFAMIAAAMAGLAASGAAAAAEKPSLDDLAFLEGHWRGGRDGLAFEEIWSAAEGGVMTGMARGVSTDPSSGTPAGELRVLEYIILSEEADGVVMRFKHFGADYASREADGPIVMPLTSASERDVTFSADPPSEGVSSIRYWMPDADTLQADIVIVKEDAQGGFTLVFDRIED